MRDCCLNDSAFWSNSHLPYLAQSKRSQMIVAYRHDDIFYLLPSYFLFKLSSEKTSANSQIADVFSRIKKIFHFSLNQFQ